MPSFLVKIYELILSHRLDMIDKRVAVELKRQYLACPKSGGILTVLDVGAGNANYWKSRAFSDLPFELEITCLDPSPRSVSEGNPNESVSFRQIQAAAPEGLTKVPENSFDLVTAFDVIEHLSKEDGYKLLYEMDRIQKTASLVYTPSKFLWQPPSVDNPFNAHISSWTQKELRALGWNDISPHIGFWCLYGPYAQRHRPLSGSRLGQLGLSLEALVLQAAPQFAFSYSAIKRKKGKRVDLFDDRTNFPQSKSQT